MSQQRIRSLDGVRGIAVLLVVVSHVAPRYFHQGGIVGVTLFFVLSGYLISTVLLREHQRTGRLDWRAFYARRALRLVPALVVLLACLPIIMWAAGDTRLDEYPVDALLALLYLGDFAQAAGQSMGLLDHTWSLAVEEQFYLVWPLVIGLLVGRRSAATMRTVVTTLAIAAIGWRLLAAALWDFDRVYFAPDTNAFALLLGCALAAHDRGRSKAALSSAWMWASLATLAFLTVVPEGASTEPLIEYGAVLMGLLGLLLVAAARGRDHRMLTLPPLLWFGKISYALYLWHVPLVYLQIDGTGMDDASRAAMAVLAVAAAWLSWLLVESPALRLKKRYERGGVPVGENERVTNSTAAS